MKPFVIITMGSILWIRKSDVLSICSRATSIICSELYIDQMCAQPRSGSTTQQRYVHAATAMLFYSEIFSEDLNSATGCCNLSRCSALPAWPPRHSVARGTLSSMNSSQTPSCRNASAATPRDNRQHCAMLIWPIVMLRWF